jgi:carbon monoxide dehydrogenase subunit G
MADTSTQSIQVSAPLDRVAAVICDFASYPEWADAMKQVEVISEYEDGYAAQVRFVIDAGVMADDYTLEYAYAEDLSRIEWHLVAPSKTQKSQDGSYDLEDNGDGTTTVTYTLAVELSIGMLGMFRRKAEKMIMDTALKQLKRRVETLSTA